MGWTVGEVMQTGVRTIGPDRTLADLDQALLEGGVSGFPVVEGDRLIGIVSRSDVVRQLSVEQTLAETLSDYYRDAGFAQEGPAESFERIAGQVGRRLEGMTVRDVMVQAVVVVAPADPLTDAARQMIERHVHRIPVVESGQLVGIVTSLDLVRLFAEGRVEPA